jgi:RimJ/RimL family protein N-acetyltransferase
VTPTLVTARLDLEPLREAHADRVGERFLDAAVWTYLPQIRPPDLAAVRKRFRQWSEPPPPEAPEALAYENWLGVDRADGVAVGAFQATVMRDGCATIGYIVFADRRRRGYALEAMRAVCAHLRAAHAVQRIFADMDRRNAGSVAVAQRLGLTEVPAGNPDDRAFEWRAVKK